jgi:hypothetical protein
MMLLLQICPRSIESAVGNRFSRWQNASKHAVFWQFDCNMMRTGLALHAA